MMKGEGRGGADVPPEPSSRPWVQPRSSGAGSGDAACRSQTLPDSPGHTPAGPSPRRWRPASGPSVDQARYLSDLRRWATS